MLKIVDQDENSQILLLQQLKNGDNTAFEQLYRLYFRRVAQWIIQNNGSLAEAEDLFQELILVLYKNLMRPDFILKGKLYSYIYGIARRMWLHQLRQRKLVTSIENWIETPDESDFLKDFNFFEKKSETTDHIERLLQLLDELKDDCRQLLSDFYLKKIQLKEIGAMMGYSDDFVRRKKMRCIEYLKKKFIA